MFTDLMNLVFPLNCINCHKVLVSGEQNLCIGCKSDLPFTDDFNHPENELFQKLSFLRILGSAGALLYFGKKNATQKLLHQLKYKGNEKVGIMLGELLGGRILDQKMQIDTIIPVPLHLSKRKLRGYNQSEKICAGIAQRTGVQIDDKSVIRVRSTSSQTKKSKIARWQNVDKVYNCQGDYEGKSILLVDDVITTGATVGILAEELQEKGAARLHIVSAARPR